LKEPALAFGVTEPAGRQGPAADRGEFDLDQIAGRRPVR